MSRWVDRWMDAEKNIEIMFVILLNYKHNTYLF